MNATEDLSEIFTNAIQLELRTMESIVMTIEMAIRCDFVQALCQFLFDLLFFSYTKTFSYFNFELLCNGYRLASSVFEHWGFCICTIK